jgi:hypothetical protein
VDGANGGERETAAIAPAEEPAARPGIRPARVVVVNVGGEELDEAPAGGVAGGCDERRYYIYRCRSKW